MDPRDLVQLSFKGIKDMQTELNYHPTDAILKRSVLLWKQMPKRSCFLDPVVKAESVKIGPQKYASHKNWMSDLSKQTNHGHTKKGAF